MNQGLIESDLNLLMLFLFIVPQGPVQQNIPVMCAFHWGGAGGIGTNIIIKASNQSIIKRKLCLCF